MWLFNRLHYQRKLTIHRKWFTLLLLSLLSVLWLERGAILVQADAHYYLDTDKSPMSMEHRMELKNEVREMFYFAFDKYMTHAFPLDELKPLNCTGRGRDRSNPHLYDNDILGDFSLTLVDTLDTFVVFNDKASFSHAIRLVIDHVSFDLDSRVQVFETTIRILGGLLSAHLLATDKRFGFDLDWYNNELLTLAYDLGLRMMPAFTMSPTGMPYSRVNLRFGVQPRELSDNCPAGVGTLILEFGMLSRLTGDPQFEKAAYRALEALWSRRSKLGLVGNTLDVVSGAWLNRMFTVGAGIDSYIEYLLKAEILFDEPLYGRMFEELYRATMLNTRDIQGYLYLWIDMHNQSLRTQFIDSLGAFFSGLQVLDGDIDNAIRGHLVYYEIWRKHGLLPERYSFRERKPVMNYYPLRPEFVESTYFLYRATKNSFYLEVGEMIIRSLQLYTRVECGFTTVEDVLTMEKANRMESFFLSETLKYLYLLFDEGNRINHADANFVFTTEAHIFPIPRQHQAQNYRQAPPEPTQFAQPRYTRIYSNVSLPRPRTCPVYPPPRHLISNYRYREDIEWIRAVIGSPHTYPSREYDGQRQCLLPHALGPWELERTQNNNNSDNHKDKGRNRRKSKQTTKAKKSTKSIEPKANHDLPLTDHSIRSKHQSKPNSKPAKRRRRLRTKWIYQNDAEYQQLVAAYINAESRHVCIPTISDLYPPHRLVSRIYHHPMNEYTDIQ